MNILEYENYQEKISHGNPLFPYITYLCSIPLDFSYVPIHWHDEMEIIYIKKGHGIITVDFTQYQVSAGTLALIIPGQLHSIEQYENESMEYENIIFHALQTKPDLILLDEPTNALDESGVDMLGDIVKKEKERGAVLIVSSHDRDILEDISDEIYDLEQGEIVRHSIKGEKRSEG